MCLFLGKLFYHLPNSTWRSVEPSKSVMRKDQADSLTFTSVSRPFHVCHMSSLLVCVSPVWRELSSTTCATCMGCMWQTAKTVRFLGGVVSLMPLQRYFHLNQSKRNGFRRVHVSQLNRLISLKFNWYTVMIYYYSFFKQHKSIELSKEGVQHSRDKWFCIRLQPATFLFYVNKTRI